MAKPHEGLRSYPPDPNAGHLDIDETTGIHDGKPQSAQKTADWVILLGLIHL